MFEPPILNQLMGVGGLLIGFAGPRVIEQTIKKKLPKGFQRAEKLEECGFVDIICERESQRRLIAKLLKHHVKIGAKYE